jgi:hypothetical protein
MADELKKQNTGETATLLAIQDAKFSIMAELKKSEPVWWKISQLALPVVLTSILGALLWVFQSKTEATLTTQSSLLKTQLGFAQYVYERRLDAYRQLYDSVVQANASVRDLRTNGQIVENVRDDLQSNLLLISGLYTANKLIATKELNAVLADAWAQAAKAANNPDQAAKNPALTTSELMDNVLLQMRKDLMMDQLSLEVQSSDHAPSSMGSPTK